MLASPVPIQTMSGFDGASATSPMVVAGPCSKIGCQVVASFSVFHRPPLAVAT